MKTNTSYLPIAVLARLSAANPPSWMRIIRDLEEDRAGLALAYSPLRRAFVAELRRPGQGHITLEREICRFPAIPNAESFKRSNRRAFDLFLSEVFPKLRRRIKGVAADRITGEFLLGGLIVRGTFHAMVENHQGERELYFVSASNLDPKVRESLIELLSLLAELCFSLPREAVNFVDLRRGEVVRPAKNFKRRREQLEATAELYSRAGRKAS